MPPKNDLSRFQYQNMASLVTTADKSALPRLTNEPTGEAESLVGRVSLKDMGTRAARSTNPELEEKKKKALKDKEKRQREREERGDEGKKKKSTMRYGDVLEATQDLEGLTYRPRTAETRGVYELLLSAVHGHLGDQPQDMIRSATDIILESLKNEDIKDAERKKEIESILGGSLAADNFSQLVALGKKITDYGDEEKGHGDEEEAVLDDDVGVAVVFDDEEEEDEEGDGFEIASESEQDPDDVQETNVDQEEPLEEELDITIGGSNQATKSEKSNVVPAREIDGFWLQRLVSQSYSDPLEASELTSKIQEHLGSSASKRDLENDLMDLTNFEHFELVKLLLNNREKIFWCTKLARSDESEKIDVQVTMREQGLGWILKELSGQVSQQASKLSEEAVNLPKSSLLKKGATPAPSGKLLDLESLAFAQGSRLMSNKKVKLPENSFKRTKKSWEEIHVPAPKSTPVVQGELVPIEKLPEWSRIAFKGNKSLNRVQSRLYPVAFGTNEPLLLCAPTGAGKTNVAMLTILNEIGNNRTPSGEILKDSFKIVYIAPMKALVQEMVTTFGTRLAPLGITVKELTGDRQLTKAQIAETQIIVTTPEKWDVITRKSTDTSYTNLVRLIIIDEIHLLHDDRGPVLESIIARTIRRMEQTQEYVRLVGLSATLPNYTDVAKFLRVDQEKGLFYFDATYRPCPLQQEFIGITEKKAMKRYQVQNEVCYEKILGYAGKEQVIVFVHSRKETSKTGRFLRDKALEEETIDRFLRSNPATREVLASEAETASDPNLKDLLPFGFAIHHAGMNRADRGTVEELFKEGHIQVLISTATLAWGVNLPAHVVIIKGTQIYNPEKGRWVELSAQDVLQMLGRAGRPQYDTYGEGIIITQHSELQYYLSMVNSQLPIESQFIKKVADCLNAEVVLGNVRSREEGVEWLGYSYLWVRMLGSPALYGVDVDYLDDDPLLVQKRSDIIHSAAVLLEKSNLLRYERTSGALFTNELGKISSNYYITHTSMSTYIHHLKSSSSIIELFRLFSISEEFKNIPVRAEEKLELAKLLERVPIPVKENIDDPAAKINVLLQSYISNLSLSGFALLADMVYVTQSAGRILRAIFEICLKRNWASLAKKALSVCQMVERKMWGNMSPLRQFGVGKGVSADLVKRAERKEFPWYRYFDLEPEELGELIGDPKAGRTLHRLVHQFPKLEISAQIQPITRSTLRMELTITPDFQWNEAVHGNSLAFWVLVTDVDGEQILYHDQFLLHQRYVEDDHFLTFFVPIMDPVAPNYFVEVFADRWVQSETRLPVSFKHLILPEKFPAPTTLLDLQPLPVSSLNNRDFQNIYVDRGIENFNKIQTQVFQALFTTNENVFIGAPAGSGKTICAEFALLRLWSLPQASRAVVIEPFEEVVKLRVAEWSTKFSNIQGGKSVVALTGETASDLRLLENADVVVCTPTQWDVLARRWNQRPAVKSIGLLIVDEVHLLGSDIGPTYEVIISRTRYISSNLKTPTRIVALGASLANARDIGGWIGANLANTFNFSPGARPNPVTVQLQAFNVPHFPSLMIQMARPAFVAIQDHVRGKDKKAICFVGGRKQCRLTANDLGLYESAALARQEAEKTEAVSLLNIEKEDLEEHLNHVDNPDLKETLRLGIGFLHSGLNKQDQTIVKTLYVKGAIQVLIIDKEIVWGLDSEMRADLLILMGTQEYEGKEHRYIDYPFTDVLQMMSLAAPTTRSTTPLTSRAILMVPQTRREFFKKFLNEGLPIESHLHLTLHDYFASEIVAKTIKSKQDAVDWLTWTWMYRRLVANPNFYNMQGVTHSHLSDYLSELVENTISDLSNSKTIAVDEDENQDLSALNLGMIASYYNISYLTIDIFSMSLTSKTKLKGLLEIISSASEFESLPIRNHEDIVLRKIYERVPVKFSKEEYDSPRFKASLLLQAHFGRLTLPPDLVQDQKIVLSKVLNLLSACVDVMSSNSYMNAINAMELSQMVVQAIWDSDSPLKQLPHFTQDVVARCQAADINSVYDLLELEDDQRDSILRMDKKQLSDVAKVCNVYPSIEVEHNINDPDSLVDGEEITCSIRLAREEDDEPTDQIVPAPFYSGRKIENLWLVIVDPQEKTLLGVKKVTLQKTLNVKLQFVCTKGKHNLKLMVVSDSWAGSDQEFEFSISVQESQDSGSEEDESDVEMAES